MDSKEKLVTKYSGEKEQFSEEKIIDSLQRAGADKETINNTLEAVRKNFKNNMHSREIYRHALKQLEEKNPVLALKYTLKKAIMDMGPAGFVFEEYIAKILKEYGYKTETGKFVRGFCVEHEVDVIAEKDRYHYMIECKYHNDHQDGSDIKTVLYVHSRFEDIKKASDARLNEYNLKEGWLATNTRVTSEAAKYARCVNLKVIAWHYPEEKNLEYYIENKRLYPVSILPGLSNKQKEILFDNNTITIQDLLEYNPDSMAKTIHTNPVAAKRLFEQAQILAELA